MLSDGWMAAAEELSRSGCAARRREHPSHTCPRTVRVTMRDLTKCPVRILMRFARDNYVYIFVWVFVNAHTLRRYIYGAHYVLCRVLVYPCISRVIPHNYMWNWKTLLNNIARDIRRDIRLQQIHSHTHAHRSSRGRAPRSRLLLGTGPETAWPTPTPRWLIKKNVGSKTVMKNAEISISINLSLSNHLSIWLSISLSV